jgi:hypothetical protein
MASAYRYTIVSILLPLLFRWLCTKTSQIGDIEAFLLIGVLMAIGGICLIIGTLISLYTQSRSALSKSEERSRGKIRSAYNRIKSLPPENKLNENQYHKFLSVLLDALNSGLTVKLVNDFLSKDLKSSLWILDELVYEPKHGPDEEIIDAHGTIFLYSHRTDADSSFLVTSIDLF